MSIYRLQRTQLLRVSLRDCWSFFSNPGNLPKITPDWLGFEVKTELPGEIYPGLMIEYRVSPLFGLKLSWLTEIVQVNPPHHFVDEQRVGPYRLWHHEHFFRELPDGIVEVKDLVHYVPPFGVLGPIINTMAIRPQLERIFDYRTRVLESLWPGPTGDSFA